MMFEKIRQIIAEQLNQDEDSITTETSFEDDLGADSVDLMEIAMALEEEFGVEDLLCDDTDLSSIQTVGDLLKFLQERIEDD